MRDIATALDILVPSAIYEGSLTDNTQDAYTALRWHDERAQPTWKAIAAALMPDPAEALAAERANMVCTRRQGKLAIGPEIWAEVEALASHPDTPWGLKVAVYDTQEWQRTDEDMAALIWAMNLTDEQADDLFRLAVTL